MGEYGVFPAKYFCVEQGYIAINLKNSPQNDRDRHKTLFPKFGVMSTAKCLKAPSKS